MNLNEFLPNVAVESKKELSELKFLELLHDHCRNSHSVIKTSPMYLQDDAKAHFFLIRPSDKFESSPFWLDKLLENLLTWRSFPDRRHCLRGFNSLDRIGNHSEAYVVIPYDHSRVGVCPDASFFRSFSEFKKFGIERLDNSGLGQWIDLLVEGINSVIPAVKLKIKTPEFYNDFKKALKTLDTAVAENKFALSKGIKEADEISDEAKRVLKDMLDRHVTTVEKYLDEKLDPHANGFATVRIDSLARSTQDKELWVSSPCLLIRRDKYIELYKQGDIK